MKMKCQVSVRRRGGALGAFAFSARAFCASGFIYSKAGGRSDLVEFNFVEKENIQLAEVPMRHVTLDIRTPQ